MKETQVKRWGAVKSHQEAMASKMYIWTHNQTNNCQEFNETCMHCDFIKRGKIISSIAWRL
jgi:hypothetical protein